MTDAGIFQELKTDHDRQRGLLERLAATEGPGEDRRALFEQLRRSVQAHAAAEEESLYAVMLANAELREDARHSVAEHKEIDDSLGELVDLDMGSGAWLPKFKQLRERYLHHIDEEEREMFPKADKTLDQRTEARITAVFEARKPEERETAARTMPGDGRE